MAVSALIAAAIIAGVIGAGGSIGAQALQNESVKDTNLLNKEINLTNNAFNAQQAQIQRDWEKEMSDTSIQRRMADLKAAGLNPMLAVSNGVASTPGAYAASSSGNAQMKAMDYSPMASIASNLGHMVNSAAYIHRLDQISKHDPAVMYNLNRIARSVSNSTTSAAKLDKISQADIDLIRGVNLWK